MLKLCHMEWVSIRRAGDDIITGWMFYLITLGVFGYLLSPMMDLPAHRMIVILTWPIGFLAILMSMPGRMAGLIDYGIMDRLRQMGYTPGQILITTWAMRTGVIVIGLGMMTAIILIIATAGLTTGTTTAVTTAGATMTAIPTATETTNATTTTPPTIGIMCFILSLFIGLSGVSAIIKFGDSLGMINDTGGVMMAVITLPLALPLLIFGAGIGLSGRLSDDLSALFPIFIGLTLITGVVSLFASHVILTRYAHE